MYVKVRPTNLGKTFNSWSSLKFQSGVYFKCLKKNYKKRNIFFNQSTNKIIIGNKPRCVVRGNKISFQLTQPLLTDWKLNVVIKLLRVFVWLFFRYFHFKIYTILNFYNGLSWTCFLKVLFNFDVHTKFHKNRLKNFKENNLNKMAVLW